jgi:upstream activation factor subunit UAF30
MEMNLESLETHIRNILSAPGTDLSTISAKRVRKRLLDVEPSLTAETLKEHKELVDGLITQVFEEVTGGLAAGDEPGAVGADGGGGGSSEGESRWEQQDDSERGREKKKRKVKANGHEARGGGSEGEDTLMSSPPKKARKSGGKAGVEMSDAEYARQLSSQINSRPSRGAARASANGSSKKGQRKKKSVAVLYSDGNDSDEEGGDAPKLKTKKTAKAGSARTAKGGFAKEYALRCVSPLCSILVFLALSHYRLLKFPTASLWRLFFRWTGSLDYRS